MLTLNDIDYIEGETTCTTLQYYQAIQRAINQGLWSMQGSYGRTMMDAINEGRCMLGVKDYKDYWGSHIPSRDQVKEGTKGSMQFVIDNMGADWADEMGRV